LSARPDSLADIAAIVRRTLAARIRDPHLIDDLTQETLARLADSDRDLSPDAQRAYAVVVARNLLASHFRGQSVRVRHLHRLVDRGGADDPAQVTIDREETDALTSALTQLDPRERDLLLRHEVAGTDLATLAGEGNVSRGAIAMRLARARASLRLEFLLAFRRVELPTDRCRDVLLALAIGDRRRQVQLDADGHVERCPACAGLVAPMTQRNRRIAGWLLIPLADGVRRAWRAVRNHPAWAAVVLVATFAATGVVFAMRSPDASRPTVGASAPPAPPSAVNAPAPSPAATDPPAPTTTPDAAPSPSAPAVPAAPSETAPPPTEPPAPTEPVPTCPPPAALDEIEAPDALQCPFSVSVVTVTEVPGGGGFSAVTAAGRPVSVQLVGAQGALPITLATGLRVSINGTVSSGPGERLAVQVAVGDLRLDG
jgi:RNA polymerase sigma factor (sigma-70 family)